MSLIHTDSAGFAEPALPPLGISVKYGHSWEPFHARLHMNASRPGPHGISTTVTG